MRDALAVEFLKLRSSRVTWITSTVAVALSPLLGVAFVILAESEGVGALAGKLDGLVVGTGWEAFLGSTGQMTAVAFFLAIGFLSVWCFGREFAENTVESLFAIRVSRTKIAGAKALLLVGWSLALVPVFLAVVGLVGLIAGLEPGLISIPEALIRLGVLATLSGLLATTLAFVASVARGYLAGVGALIGVIAIAQVTVLFGSGGWFPFAAPGLWAVSWQDPVVDVSRTQLAMVPLFVAVVLGVTVRWWGRFELD